MNAAKDCGLKFVGRNTPDNIEVFKDTEYKIDDIREILRIIQEIEK